MRCWYTDVTSAAIVVAFAAECVPLTTGISHRRSRLPSTRARRNDCQRGAMTSVQAMLSAGISLAEPGLPASLARVSPMLVYPPNAPACFCFPPIATFHRKKVFACRLQHELGIKQLIVCHEKQLVIDGSGGIWRTLAVSTRLTAEHTSMAASLETLCKSCDWTPP